MANILITNDDGIHSDGLLALYESLEPVGKVTVIAPDRPRSASGHAITLHKPLRADKVPLAGGAYGYSSNGTPADCVCLGALKIVEGPVDLVVAGINRGPNLGFDLTYSGTVSAAMEAAVMGISSFAISITTHEAEFGFGVAGAFARHVADILLARKLPSGMFLNVNLPDAPSEQITGVEITRQGVRHYDGRVETRSDPMGRTYYWLGGDLPVDVLEEGTDVKAIADNKISITPIDLDLTATAMIESLREWSVTQFPLGPAR